MNTGEKMKDTLFSIISQQDLDGLSEFLNMPIVIFNEHELLYANHHFLKSIHDDQLDPIFYNVYNLIDLNLKNEKQEIAIKNRHGDTFWFDCLAHDVTYHDESAIFAFMFDVSERVNFHKEATKLSKLRQLIIEISQNILDARNIHDFFNFVLNKALKITERANLGTILVLTGDNLQPVASYGYDKAIHDFILPLQESFIYKATDGKVGKIVNIPDATIYTNYVPIETKFGNARFIKSSLSAPIHIENKLYGIINLDSTEKNAFEDEDVQALEFVRNSIEIAITNRLLYEEKAFLSQFDQLTSLHNRYFFEEYSGFVIKKAERYHETFHLIMIDIDLLKHVNDQYGHLVGDMLIKEVSQVIINNTRKSDVFARYGGDEFVGLMFNLTDSEVQDKLCLIRTALLMNPIQYNNQEITVSISYGMATYPDDGKTIPELIHVADKRMYFLKDASKNGVK